MGLQGESLCVLDVQHHVVLLLLALTFLFESVCSQDWCSCTYFSLPQTFVDAAILAYECGMNEDSLRHELKVYKASLEQQVAPPGMVRAALLQSCS